MNTETTKTGKYGFALALRLLFFCFLFFILPLIFHTFVDYRKTVHDTLKERFELIDVLGKNAQSYFELAHILGNRSMDLFAHSKTLESENIQVIAKEYQLADLFILNKEAPDTYRCSDAAQKKRNGTLFPYSQYLKTLAIGEDAHFAGYDEISKTNIVFTVYAVSKEKFYVIGKSTDQWLYIFEKNIPPYRTYSLTLADNKKNIFSTNGPSFSFQKTEILSLEDSQEKLFPLNGANKELIAIRAPLIPDNLFLYIAFSKISIERDVIKTSLIRLAVFFLSLLVIGGSLVWFFTLKIMKPFKELTSTMTQVGKGDTSVRYQKRPFGFEINRIGASFNQTVDDLVSHMQQEESQRLKAEAYKNELTVAKQLQESLFPKQIPAFPTLDIATCYLPAKEISGDFYDFFPKNDKLFFVIADASGKGVPSALYSLTVRSMLRTSCTDLDDFQLIIDHTNHLFSLDTQDSGYFVTAWVGMYDPNTRSLHYTSAGHLPVLLKKASGEIHQLTTEGIALGVLPEAHVSIAHLTLDPQDTLFLYTDGISEAQNSQGRLYTLSRLIQFLQGYSNKTSQDLLDALLKDIGVFTGDTPQADDITALAVRIL